MSTTNCPQNSPNTQSPRSTNSPSRHGRKLVAALLVALMGLVLFPTTSSAQVNASVSVNPDPATAGSIVTVRGSAFQPGETVSIEFAGPTLAVATADANGSFTASGRVDGSVPAGAHPLDANGDMGSWATYDLTIIAAPAPTTAPPAPQPAPAANPQVRFADPVPAGSSTMVRGSGFLPGERIRINFGGSTVGRTVASASGEWSTSITVPSHMPVGGHPLDVIGALGTNVDTDLTVSAPVVARPAPTVAPQPTTPRSTVPKPTVPQTSAPQPTVPQSSPAAPAPQPATQQPAAPSPTPAPQSSQPAQPTSQGTPVVSTPSTPAASQQSTQQQSTPQPASGNPVAKGVESNVEGAEQTQRGWVRQLPSDDTTATGEATVIGSISEPGTPAVDESVTLPRSAQAASNADTSNGGLSTTQLILLLGLTVALTATVVTGGLVVRERMAD